MKKALWVVCGGLLFLGMIVLFGLIVMALWNRLLPDIFRLPKINFWQAAGLLILARVLFGGIGSGMGNKFGHRNPFRNKWTGMSGKEREDFLQKRRHIHRDYSDRHDGKAKNE